MIKSLELLRFIAAFLVLLSHTPNNLDVFLLNSFFNGNIFLGSLGVDIFFIISGFVISLSAVRIYKSRGDKINSAFNFVLLRVIRIFPLYIVVTVVYIVVSSLFLGKNFTSTEIFNSIFLLPVNNNNIYLDPIIYAGWTLRFELFFYFIISISILFNNINKLPFIILLTSIFLGEVYGWYFGSTIIIEFGLGYILGLNYKKIQYYQASMSKKALSIILLMSTALLLFCMLGRDSGVNEFNIPRMDVSYGNISLPRWIAWGGPCFLFTLSMLLCEKKYTWRGYWLGKLTYSLYLWQIIFIGILNRVIITHVGNNMIAFIIFTIMSLLVSYLSFKYIESPFNYKAKNIFR